ncbi:MAG: hypothetical protein IKS39_03755 [Clostridia bacterium]|nr:hypothetical protein [Clostridia bacterium]
MELVNNLEVKSKNAEIIAKILDCDIDGKVCDVVEVVRCKDCKFYESFGNKDFHCGECLNVGYDSPTKTVPKDGFCYEAERKETK